jgi:hypothetical protein
VNLYRLFFDFGGELKHIFQRPLLNNFFGGRIDYLDDRSLAGSIDRERHLTAGAPYPASFNCCTAVDAARFSARDSADDTTGVVCVGAAAGAAEVADIWPIYFRLILLSALRGTF